MGICESLLRGGQTFFTALQELTHLAAKDHRGQLISVRNAFGFAEVPSIGALKIDDTTSIVEGADSFLILMDESHEFHRRTPSDRTTWCDSSPIAGEKQRRFAPVFNGTGFCSRSPRSAMLAPMARKSPGLIPRIDQRAMICSMVNTQSRRVNFCLTLPSIDNSTSMLSSSFRAGRTNMAGPMEVLEGKFFPSKLLVVRPSRRLMSRAVMSIRTVTPET